MQKAKLVIAVLVLIIAIILVVQNSEMVETRLLVTTIEMSRAVLLMITLAIGFILGVLTAFLVSRKSKAASS